MNWMLPGYAMRLRSPRPFCTPDRRPPVADRRCERGFTLIELMVVVSIIIILISVAVPSYLQHVKRAREAVLREDLYQMQIGRASCRERV